MTKQEAIERLIGITFENMKDNSRAEAITMGIEALRTINENEQLLIRALNKYIEKWTEEKERLEKTENNIRILVQRNSMLYLAQWIINSINGGLDKPHGTNICNILWSLEVLEDAKTVSK